MFYDYSAHSKEENFERTCVRKLHNVWFPSFSFNQLERIYTKDNSEDVINYDWYSRRLAFINTSVPVLSFRRVETPWSMNLHELLQKDIRKTDLYKSWCEQPSDGLAFPLVGTVGIIYETYIPPDFDCVSKYIKSTASKEAYYIIISLLTDYATLFKEPQFND